MGALKENVSSFFSPRKNFFQTSQIFYVSTSLSDKPIFICQKIFFWFLEKYISFFLLLWNGQIFNRLKFFDFHQIFAMGASLLLVFCATPSESKFEPILDLYILWNFHKFCSVGSANMTESWKNAFSQHPVWSHAKTLFLIFF